MELSEYLSMDAVQAAPRLLGSLLIMQQDNGRKLTGRIVETEAYDQSDAASHSYKGRTPRSDVMFGPAGHLYVYFTYGMHYCCNVVTGLQGHGSGVLIRAVEPLAGQKAMEKNRHGRSGTQLTNGPAKLCEAYGIDRTWNGHDLTRQPLTLQLEEPLAADQIAQTTRIGITRAKEEPWRFYIRGNPYVSKP